MTDTSRYTHEELTARLAEVEPVAFAFEDSLTGELRDFSCTQHSTGMTPLYTHPQPAQQVPDEVEIRPDNCRNRLQSEGKAYPKSGCDSCGTGGRTGCPYERKEQAQ